MEDAAVVSGNGIKVDSGPDGDHDLTMASRESAQHATSIQNAAYRHALNELAGELYVEAYKSMLRQTVEKHRAGWRVSEE